jgi:hypothetical protein
MVEYGIAVGGVSGSNGGFDGARAADMVMSVGTDPMKLLVVGAALAVAILVFRAI